MSRVKRQLRLTLDSRSHHALVVIEAGDTHHDAMLDLRANPAGLEDERLLAEGDCAFFTIHNIDAAAHDKLVHGRCVYWSDACRHPGIIGPHQPAYCKHLSRLDLADRKSRRAGICMRARSHMHGLAQNPKCPLRLIDVLHTTLQGNADIDLRYSPCAWIFSGIALHQDDITQPQRPLTCGHTLAAHAAGLIEEKLPPVDEDAAEFLHHAESGDAGSTDATPRVRLLRQDRYG